MKRYIAVFLFCFFFSNISLLCAVEEETAKTPEEKPDTMELEKSLADSDVVVVATVKNAAVGKARNYAVLEITEALKGAQGGKTLYVGFDPASQSDFFQSGKKGLWMLDAVEGASHLIPVKGKFFDENTDAKQIGEILAGQNSIMPEDIEFSVKTDKTEYAIDEPIRIEMTVKNKGAKSVTFDDALLWKFTHTYSLTLEKDSGTENFKIEKPAGGIIGEFAGPQFVRMSPGESRSRTFNLIRLIVDCPPEKTSLSPQLPKCKGSLAVTWNTKALKEFFPDAKCAFAIEGTWTSPENKFDVTAKEAEFPEGAIKEIEKISGVANILGDMDSNDEKTFKRAEEAFVEYAVPALEPDLRKMLRSDNPTRREAAGRAFLRLAQHPKFIASNALLEYLSKPEEISDAGAYNQVLSYIASTAIRQNRKEYVALFISVLESDKATILAKKEVVSALASITGLELSEENFDKTIEDVKKWLEKPDPDKPEEKVK